MCFSATASFTTAAITGATGLFCLTRASRPQDLPLAATPLLFAVQQGVEGLLWLKLPEGPSPATTALTIAFLLFAQVVWPLYAPIAVALAEPDPRRRRLIASWLAVGGGIAAYLFWGLVTRRHQAAIVDDHMVYDVGARAAYAPALAYLAAVTAPLLLSSQRTILALGATVLLGSVLAYLAYFHAFQSVWCYFAAAGSAVILAHFQWIGLRGRSAAVPVAS